MPGAACRRRWCRLRGLRYWLARATAALESARTEIGALKQGSADGAVLNDLDAAAAAIDQLVATRGELSRMLRNDMRSQAGSLVFGEALEAAATASERIEGARIGELSRTDSELAAARAYELLGAGIALALGLVLIGLLLPTAAEELEPSATIQASGLREPARVVSAAPVVSAAATLEAPAAPEPQPIPVPEGAPPAEAASADGTLALKDRRKAPELRAAADLCTDFARLVDARELPALLDRAAKLLDATGFIVWLADPGGQALRPSLAHGYPPHALARLPPIARNSDNATAAAYRHAEMQIVRTNGMSPGAIVVPLLGPSGCVGAVAAEVRHGREASESLRALARIVAAQISTLVAASAGVETPATPAERAEARQATG